jgi:hypothetical protein
MFPQPEPRRSDLDAHSYLYGKDWFSLGQTRLWRHQLFGVCLVSVFIGHEGDLVGLKRTNGVVLTLSVNAAMEVFR